MQSWLISTTPSQPASKLLINILFRMALEKVVGMTRIILRPYIYKAPTNRAGSRRAASKQIVSFYSTMHASPINTAQSDPDIPEIPTGITNALYHLAKKPKKLLLFPTFCAFSALRSIALFPFGNVGIGGPLRCGLGGLVVG